MKSVPKHIVAMAALAVTTTLLVIGLAVALSVYHRDFPGPLPFFPSAVAFMLVGAMLVLRGERAVVGWLMLLCAVSRLGGMPNELATIGLAMTPRLDSATWAALLDAVTRNLELLPLVLLAVVYPNGRPLSGLWRAFTWIAISIFTSDALLTAVSDVSFSCAGCYFPGVDHPLPLLPATHVLLAYDSVVFLELFVVIPGAMLSIVLRLRRNVHERALLRWPLLACAATVVSALGFAALGIPPTWARVLLFPLLPLAIGVALLRPRPTPGSPAEVRRAISGRYRVPVQVA